MVNISCVTPPVCDPVAVPLPPSPPVPPSSGGGSIIVEDSDTINLSGTGTADDPLRAELAFPLRINLASTSYDQLTDGDEQMVYSAAEVFTFVNAESTGAVRPAVSTTLNMQVNGVGAGTVTITGTDFVFNLNETIVINPDDEVRLFATEAFVFDYLAITIVGNVTP